MGAGSSRPRTPRARDRRVAGGSSAVRLKLASFLCGGASTTAAAASSRRVDEASERSWIEDGPKDTNIYCTHLSTEESPVRSLSSRSASSSSTTCPSRIYGLEDSTVDLIYAESSVNGKGLCQSQEIAPLENGVFHLSYARNSCDLPSTSGKQALEPMSMHTDAVSPPLMGADNTANTYSAENPLTRLSNLSQLQSSDSPTDFISSSSNRAPVDGDRLTSILNPTSSVSDSATTSQLAGGDCRFESSSSNSTLHTSSSLGERRNGGILHLAVISISSISSSSNGEARASESGRMSRRLLWNSLSRPTSRRNSSQSIFSAIEDARDLEYEDRWLLDVDDDRFENGEEDDSANLRRRRHGTSRRRWHSRSELRDRLHGSLDDSGINNTCPSGLHPDGMCSCYSFLVDDTSSARASISRVVMLAEALFEILDEIHHQPASLFSMVPLAAPDSVVDSLPVKRYKKVEETGSREYFEQCFICLSEYEEGDNIRILPCHHEYHMWCVDKWLKEIHGVCPLCRGDVCQGAAEVSAT